MKPKVIVILGQTATGKSTLAVKLAEVLAVSGVETEIISADSRQVYKNLNVGTGKITKKEMSGVPHHLLDVANPKKQFTVAQYKELANEKIKEIIARGKVPIICGGTGFYIDAVTKGIVLPEVPPNPKLRSQLVIKSAIALFIILQKLDPARAKSIDPKNKVRLIRAIEIVKAIGKVPKIVEVTPPFKFIKIGLFMPRGEFKKKVEIRVKKMFRKGLLNEIKKLKRMGVTEKRLQELGFEYYHPEKDQVILKTIQYAKRQMTWFKRDKEIIWYDASEVGSGEMVTKILKLL